MRGCGKRTLVWLALAALSTPVATQTVHTVGPSGFAQIGGAIAVASPGDIIKVDSGFYHEFSCDGHLIGLAATTEIQLGVPYQVSFQAEPNEALFVLASLDLRSQLPVFSQEATWLPANDVFFMGLAAADSAGLATFAIGVPGHASLDHKSIWLHAAALSTSPWRIGAPVGGVIR